MRLCVYTALSMVMVTAITIETKGPTAHTMAAVAISASSRRDTIMRCGRGLVWVCPTFGLPNPWGGVAALDAGLAPLEGARRRCVGHIVCGPRPGPL